MEHASRSRGRTNAVVCITNRGKARETLLRAESTSHTIQASVGAAGERTAGILGSARSSIESMGTSRRLESTRQLALYLQGSLSVKCVIVLGNVLAFSAFHAACIQELTKCLIMASTESGRANSTKAKQFTEPVMKISTGNQRLEAELTVERVALVVDSYGCDSPTTGGMPNQIFFGVIRWQVSNKHRATVLVV